MPDLVEQYKSIKKKYDDVVITLASEEASFKTMKEQYDEKLTELKTNYNVSSLSEAEALLEKESKELEAEVIKASELLNSINAE